MRAAASGLLSILGSNSSKKIIMVENNHLEVIQEYILKENLQIKYGGIAPNVTYGEDNLFPPVVPSDKYTKNDEKLNIVTPEVYKEMCLHGNPFRPFVINDSLNKIWQKEEKLNHIKEKQKLKMKKSFSGYNIPLKVFIVEFENKNIRRLLKNRNIFYNKYKPKKININIIKSFFNEKDNIHINTINN